MLTIPLQNNHSTSLYEQIYSYIKKEIINGTLPCHTKLPSTRSLASHLSISRNTVDLAYSQLVSEGYIESKPKSGYYVCQISSFHNFTKPATSYKEENTESKKHKYIYDFSPFSVDLSCFPYQCWRQISKKCLQDHTDLFLLGDNQGDLALRSSVARYLHESRGVNCTKEQIVVGAGVDYLLQMLTHILGRDAIVAMENPAYLRANRIFRDLGIQTVPISLDTHGISIEALKKSPANIAYVTPSHQYPLGISMPIKRRFELLEWANANSNRYIIEDDYDSEFRYKGKPLPSLQGIATHDNVIYIGTFSRAIAPAIRVGYMVLPYPLLEIYKNRFSYFASTVSRIDQAILTQFIDQGHFERHLNRMRKVYKTKHDLLLTQWKESGIPVKISGEHAGMHLIIQFLEDIDEQSLLLSAKKEGICLYGLYEHFLIPPLKYQTTLLMGYASLSEDEIVDGCQSLFKLIKSHGLF